MNAQTGVKAFETEFTFQMVPGSGEDSFGMAHWGFSPDDFDRTFVYAYVNGQSSFQWNLVNLEQNQISGNSSGLVYNETILSTSAFWQFSPCGDLIGLVTQPSAVNMNVRLFQTLNGSILVNTTFTLANIVFRSNLTSHIANVGGTDQTLMSNTADDACAGGGGTTNTPPTAAFTFTPASGVKPGIAVTFTDQSSDPDGGISADSFSNGTRRFSLIFQRWGPAPPSAFPMMKPPGLACIS